MRNPIAKAFRQNLSVQRERFERARMGKPATGAPQEIPQWQADRARHFLSVNPTRGMNDGPWQPFLNF